MVRNSVYYPLIIVKLYVGQVTPLANITITSINLAVSGHSEALSGACIAYVAASTFNAQVKAWEPLIEPFEGIFK